MYTYVGVQLPEIAGFNLQEPISICLHIHSVTKESPVPLCLGTKNPGRYLPCTVYWKKMLAHLGTFKTPTSGTMATPYVTRHS